MDTRGRSNLNGRPKEKDRKWNHFAKKRYLTKIKWARRINTTLPYLVIPKTKVVVVFSSGSWHGSLEGHVWRGAWASVAGGEEELDQLPEGRGHQLRRLLPLQRQHRSSQTGECSAVKIIQVTFVNDKHGPWSGIFSRLLGLTVVITSVCLAEWSRLHRSSSRLSCRCRRH